MRYHLISYPKSGRTWIRFVFTQLGNEPQIRFSHDGFEFNDGARPSHDFSLQRRFRKYAASDRLIYLERNPQDVMVSLFHQVTGRFNDFFSYTGTLSDFIRDDYFGADNLQRFRTMWSEIIVKQGFMKVTYEECHADMGSVMRRMLNYYGFDVPQEELVAAVENARFENMKQLEQSGTFPEPWLRPRNDFPKVRAGRVAGYRDILEANDIAYLESIFSTPHP